MSTRPLNEDPETSCQVLAHFISEPLRALFQPLLLQDFVTKQQHLRPEVSTYFKAKVFANFLPSEVKDLVKASELSAPQPKPKVDIAVVTIIEEELSAAKAALGIDLTRLENRNVRGLRFWETEFLRSGQQPALTAVLTMVGRARNIECAVACNRLFNAYNVGACVLIGIAAGLKEKVKLGDVVVADEMILDYEGQRLEPDGPKKRPTPYTVDLAIRRDLGHYKPNANLWNGEVQRCLATLKEDNQIELPEALESWRSNYHTGVILAGEKMLADGSLPQMRQEYHEKVRAAEMEGSGFARACDEYSIPWLVFRGVSDFGDPNKPEAKRWRSPAAIAAATCAVAFLKAEFRKREEKAF